MHSMKLLSAKGVMVLKVPLTRLPSVEHTTTSALLAARFLLKWMNDCRCIAISSWLIDLLKLASLLLTESVAIST